jgi:shikimate kinase
MRETVVAEIVGPAGAGKSTLASALRRRSGDDVRAGLGVWGLPASLLLSTAVRSLPQLLGLWRVRGAVGWHEATLYVRLNALGRLLGRESSRACKFLLLDEGTVFALAKLHAFGGAGDEGRLGSLVERTASKLDAVVWLDAPDEVLAQRIRGREKPHRMKARTDEEISDFLARYRESYERVVSELCARRGVKVIRVCTDGQTPEQVAEEVLRGIRTGA